MLDTILCAHCHASAPNHVSTCPSCQADPRLQGRYRLLERIGHGAVGTTYRALAPDGTIVAVKELLVRRLDTFKTEELFNREAATLRALSHPSIPRYLDHFTTGDGRNLGFYLVIEYVDGQTLSDELKARLPTEDDVVATLEDVARTLEYLQDCRPAVIHRDIKTKNLMRHRDGRLMLIDFGAVREVARDSDGGSTVAGTFGYMAPEQFAGLAEPSSDIYSLGVVAVEMLTGRPPQTLIDERNQLAWQGAVSGIAPELRYILERMLAPARTERIQTARELLALLDQYRSGTLSIRAPVPPAPTDTDAALAAAGLPPEARKLLSSPLGGLLQGLAAKAQTHLDGESGRITPLGPPPPPAPRRIPWGFGTKAIAGGGTSLLIGLIFAAVGLSVSLSGFMGAQWRDSHSGEPVGPWLPFFFGLIFFLVGGGLSLSYFRKVTKLRRAFRHGEAAVGRVTDVSINASVKYNGRSPRIIHVEFTGVDGTHIGEFQRMNSRGFPVGQEVHVIYDPQHPEKIVPWPLV